MTSTTNKTMLILELFIILTLSFIHSQTHVLHGFITDVTSHRTSLIITQIITKLNMKIFIYSFRANICL